MSLTVEDNDIIGLCILKHYFKMLAVRDFNSWATKNLEMISNFSPEQQKAWVKVMEGDYYVDRNEYPDSEENEEDIYLDRRRFIMLRSESQTRHERFCHDKQNNNKICKKIRA